jgi:hypothetical protein
MDGLKTTVLSLLNNLQLQDNFNIKGTYGICSLLQEGRRNVTLL